MLRRASIVLAFVVATLWVMPLAAQGAAGAQQFVSQLSSQAIRVMTGPGLSDSQRATEFRHLFIAAVDLPAVGKRVLGRYWRTASPEERQQFLSTFEDVLVSTWANRFKNTEGDVRLQISNTGADASGGARVDSVILKQNQEPIPVVWHLRQQGGDWRIVDLDVAGTSMDVTYRDEYAAYIAGHGGSVTALNEALRRKAGQLSQAPPGAGTPSGY